METILKTKVGAPGEHNYTANDMPIESSYAGAAVETVEKLSLRRMSYLTPAEDPYNAQAEMERLFITQQTIDSLDDADDDEDDEDDLDEIDLDEEEDIVVEEDDDVSNDELDDDIDLDDGDDDEDDDDII
jgi:hypothetical protein